MKEQGDSFWVTNKSKINEALVCVPLGGLSGAWITFSQNHSKFLKFINSFEHYSTAPASGYYFKKLSNNYFQFKYACRTNPEVCEVSIYKITEQAWFHRLQRQQKTPLLLYWINCTTTKLTKIRLVGSCPAVVHFLSGLDLFYTEVFEAYLNFKDIIPKEITVAVSHLNLDTSCYDGWEILKRLAAYRLGVDHITSSFHIVWGIWAVKLSIVVSTSRLIWIWCHPVWLHPPLCYRLILTQLFWNVCMQSRQTSIRISINCGKM